MIDETLELIERARRRLDDRGAPCAIAGGVPESAIAAAEEALACALPPSYRAFLRRYGTLSLPHGVSTIHHFLGLAKGSDQGMVERTQHARIENRLGRSLVLVAIGADGAEWFCLDTDRARPDGECPVFLFDARDNQLDQQFYDDFAAMIREVVSFVIETLDEGGEITGAAGPDHDEARATGTATGTM